MKVKGFIEGLQQLVPWLAGLPFVPKIVISVIILLVAIFILLLIWFPTKEDRPPETPAKQIQEEPEFIIEYKENEPDYFAQSFKQGQLYRISVKNSSPTKMINNMQTKLIKIEPPHPVFQYIRPLLFRFMGDTKENPDQSTNLGPSETIFINVIELHASNSQIEIPTSELEKQTTAIINKDDIYTITIQITGDGAETKTKQFKFGISTNEFGGDWKLWFLPVNQETSVLPKEVNKEKEELKSMIKNTLDELDFNIGQYRTLIDLTNKKDIDIVSVLNNTPLQKFLTLDDLLSNKLLRKDYSIVYSILLQNLKELNMFSMNESKQENALEGRISALRSYYSYSNLLGDRLRMTLRLINGEIDEKTFARLHQNLMVRFYDKITGSGN